MKITIQTVGGPREIEADAVKGGLALHDAPDHLFDMTITHIASGRAVCYVSGENGRRALHRIAPLLDWTQPMERVSTSGNLKLLTKALGRHPFDRSGA